MTASFLKVGREAEIGTKIERHISGGPLRPKIHHDGPKPTQITLDNLCQFVKPFTPFISLINNQIAQTFANTSTTISRDARTNTWSCSAWTGTCGAAHPASAPRVTATTTGYAARRRALTRSAAAWTPQRLGTPARDARASSAKSD